LTLLLGFGADAAVESAIVPPVVVAVAEEGGGDGGRLARMDRPRARAEILGDWCARRSGVVADVRSLE
jgi:hypothetical protein